MFCAYPVYVDVLKHAYRNVKSLHCRATLMMRAIFALELNYFVRVLLMNLP